VDRFGPVVSTFVKVSGVLGVLPALAVAGIAVTGMPSANADNKRLNDGVVANVARGRRAEQPRPRRRHRLGRFDGSTVQDRAGFTGTVSETVAVYGRPG